jgi:hypothetical protein
METTTQIATETAPNGLTIATDLAPFAKFVNGTVTSATFFPKNGSLENVWNVRYRTAKRSLSKYVPAEKVGA